MLQKIFCLLTLTAVLAGCSASNGVPTLAPTAATNGTPASSPEPTLTPTPAFSSDPFNDGMTARRDGDYARALAAFADGRRDLRNALRALARERAKPGRGRRWGCIIGDRSSEVRLQEARVERVDPRSQLPCGPW